MRSEQQRLPLTTTRTLQPAQVAAEGARAYTQGRYVPPMEDLQDDPQAAFQMGQEYTRNLRSGARPSPRLMRSYAAMRDETNRQYDFVTKTLGVKHDVVDEDPYKSPADMIADVNQGHIKTFSTRATGGHMYFSDEENDRFRAVHDFFGHAAIGRNFGRHGEEAAFQSHVQMFPAVAREAMASETRGQNTQMNYGPGGFVPQDTLVGASKFMQSPDASKIRKQRTYLAPPASNDVQQTLPGMRRFGLRDKVY